MKITILTLFPELFDGLKNHSIIKRAIQKQILNVEIVNFRTFSLLSNQSVDDTAYGGGAGMVLRLEPIVAAIKHHRTANSKVYLMSPQGETFEQATALKMSKCDDIILIAGHYEGFDQRLINYVDGEISVGNFILTGGEIPCMIVVDAITRLLDGAINQESLAVESFDDNLLDYDVYTKPLVFDGHQVPEVLTSGDHQKIAKWRQTSRITKTKIKRPDLYQKYLLENKESNHGKN